MYICIFIHSHKNYYKNHGLKIRCKPNSNVSWSTSELRVRLVHRLTSLNPPVNILLTVPRRYFFCGSFMFFPSCVCYAFVRACLCVSCGHLQGKGWPLGSRLWCLTVSLLLSQWYPGSGVVLDCIDYWSLHPYLLSSQMTFREISHFNGTSPAVSADSYYRNYMYHAHVHVGAILYHCAKDSKTC